MSSQSAPLPAMGAEAGLFLEPVTATAEEPAPRIAHHPQAKPQDHMCTCGKVREACVHDEVRAFWSAVASA